MSNDNNNNYCIFNLYVHCCLGHKILHWTLFIKETFTFMFPRLISFFGNNLKYLYLLELILTPLDLHELSQNYENVLA